MNAFALFLLLFVPNQVKLCIVYITSVFTKSENLCAEAPNLLVLLFSAWTIIRIMRYETLKYSFNYRKETRRHTVGSKIFEN